MGRFEKEPTNYKKLSNKLANKLANSFNNSEDAINLLNQVRAGNNQYLKYQRIVNSAYDNRWVSEIEDCLYDLGQIIKNPRSVTKDVGDVVPVELARKINAESIMHLTTHSQFVKDIDENGDVIPNKILNIGSDDFYQTYENRFIATLVRKLVIFVEKRYQYLEENADVKKSQVLMVRNKSIVDGREVEIETKVKISNNEISDEIVNTNKSFIIRVKELKRYLLYYYNSDFMKMMKTERNVKNPILMTNIIRKNPLYNHCYQLYKFIEKYDLIGIDFKVSDKYEKLTPEELEELNNLMAVNFLSIRPEEAIRNPVKKLKKYHPHVITNTDDDKFIYGPYYVGPVEFVRADDRYLRYLDALKKPTPIHPTKEERAYYGDDYALNKEIRDELKEIAALLSRKKRDYKETLKEFERIALERELEEEAARLEQLRQEEDERLRKLEQARRDLINSARPQQDEVVEEPTSKNPFENLQSKPFIPFINRLESADPSLINGYLRIRHEALCYGLKSRISQKADTFMAHGKTYLKLNIVGKTLKSHYALNPENYLDSPIPVIDDSHISMYEDIPSLLKVRSELSVKRAIIMIHDLAEMYGLEYHEVPFETLDQLLAKYNVLNEKEEPKDVNPFANLAKRPFVPFSDRLLSADPALADGYKRIRHHAMCYGLRSRVSQKADTFMAHGRTFVRISIVGKSLKIHYALNPNNYADSPIPVIDDSTTAMYENIPLLFKVRSDLSIRRAMLLIDDLAKLYGFEYKEIPMEEMSQYEEIEQEVEETPEIEETPTEVSNVPYNPFANLAKRPFVPFSDRLLAADQSLADGYKRIRHHAMCYGLRSRVSQKADTFMAHGKTFVKMSIVGKTLKVHYALNPQSYEDSPIPVIDDSTTLMYENIPTLLKVRSDLSIRRAILLIDDVAKLNGFEYKEIPMEEMSQYEEIEADVVETPDVEENSDEVSNVPYNPFANLAKRPFVPFADRLMYADPSLVDSYKKIRRHAMCYGLKSRLSQRGDTFMAHGKTFVKMSIVGKTLKVHYALNINDYENSPIPLIDDSATLKYENVPVLLKVRSDLSTRRAMLLIDDLAKLNGFEYREIAEEEMSKYEEVEQEVIETPQTIEVPEVEKTPTDVIDGPYNPFAHFKNNPFIPFEDRLSYADPSLVDGYKQIKHTALCYGLKSRLSQRADTFMAHGKTFMKMSIVGKTLKVHYALDPADYLNSPLPVVDDSSTSMYENIPLLLKVRSDLSIRRAISLIEDLAKKNGFEYNEVVEEEIENNEDVIETKREVVNPKTIEEVEQVLENVSEEEVTNTVATNITYTASSPFGNIIRHEFVPFEQRVNEADDSLIDAYNKIRHEAICYGLKSRISQRADSFMAHNMTFIKIAIVGKMLKVHFALDPNDYVNSTIPVSNDADKTLYRDVPVGLKVRSDLSVKRALMLIQDMAKKYNLVYVDMPFEEVKREDKPIEHKKPVIVENKAPVIQSKPHVVENKAPVIETPIVKEEQVVVPNSPFGNIVRHEFVPFEQRVLEADESLVNAYNLIRERAMSYGLKSRISQRADTFMAHNMTFIKIAIVGKMLKVHFALDPKDYINSTIPVTDDGEKTLYKEVPVGLKVRSDLSVKRALMLIDDLAKKYNLKD